MKKDPALSTCLPGFEKVYRYWDPGKNLEIAKIQPGEFYVTQQNEAISTVLGSCIAACIRDTDLKVGGMNHFMLPLLGNQYDASAIANDAARYGNWAMEYLINQILKAGGRRRALEIKIFGGGNVVSSIPAEKSVGEKNIQFILNYLYDENLTLRSKDVGGSVGRNILYYPKTGKVLVKHLDSCKGTTLIEDESKYLKSISKKEVKPDIELF